MKPRLILFSLILFFITVWQTSCKHRKADARHNIEISKKVGDTYAKEKEHIEDLLDSKDICGIQLHFKDELDLLYQYSSYYPVWFDEHGIKPCAYQLIARLKNTEEHGLPKGIYYGGALDSFINAQKLLPNNSVAAIDILLSHSYFLYASHLRFGLLDSSLTQIQIEPEMQEGFLSELLSDHLKTGHVIEVLDSLEPSNYHFRILQGGLGDFLGCYPLTDKKILVPDRKSDSIHCMAKASAALIVSGFADSSIILDSKKLETALKRFQRMNGLLEDGLIGVNTAKLLSQSNFDRFLKACISIEKIKHDVDFSGYHILINIPAFKLKLIMADSLMQVNKVIVGKPATKTPIVSSAINNIITNPYWNVPYSIATKEILPKLRRNPAYLEKNGFELLDASGHKLNPYAINWNNVTKGNFSYRIRQESGEGNSLGYIKFNFLNPFSVYLHDTQNRNLFTTEMRAYSHGCVRVQNPVQLAGIILMNDSSHYTRDSVQALIDSGTSVSISLKKSYPIFIRYFTSDASKEEGIKFYSDIYKRDSLVDLLFRKQDWLY